MIGILDKVQLVRKLLPQMGWRYVSYRIKHIVNTRLGSLKQAIPVNPGDVPGELLTLSAFRQNKPAFFPSPIFAGLERCKDDALASRALEYRNNIYTYFSSTQLSLADEMPWNTHPLTKKEFPLKHWSEIPDMDDSLGDIKYIWEPSRFSHLYTFIRDDYHNETDNGAIVFAQINDWLSANPVNVGPNYKCSQEISLRILNWTFALHYYADHIALTEELWKRIQENIYWSLHHVYHHIDFSRIAVRNNHAITETGTLWLAGKLFPWLPKVAMWSKRGKEWLEEELDYQIYTDGTYIQHSHNYQRVVAQLLTWFVYLGDLHDDPLSEEIKNKAGVFLEYLSTMMQKKSGFLPNYGANDGALFFPLASQAYRDYRPQLDALARALREPSISNKPLEEAFWTGGAKTAVNSKIIEDKSYSFPIGGQYVLRDKNVFASIKAQSFKDRPSQADNLHLDLWIDGINILRDQGTYQYNTDPETADYFFGTRSHNAALLGKSNQMKRFGRFIFFDWTTNARGSWISKTKFRGTIDGFADIGAGITQTRTVEFFLNEKKLNVKDEFSRKPENEVITQYWHPHPKHIEFLNFKSVDANGVNLELQHTSGFYSSAYGIKEPVTDLIFQTTSNSLTTEISWL